MCSGEQTVRVVMDILPGDDHGMAAETALRGIFRINGYKENSMNKDQVKGRVDEATGKVQEVTGKLIGDKEMELDGRVKKAGGKLQAGFGDIKEDIKKSAP